MPLHTSDGLVVQHYESKRDCLQPGERISRFLFPLRGGNHLSRMPVTRHLMQSTRSFKRDGQPLCSCLTLLPMGFTELRLSPTVLVRSYRAVSPSHRQGDAIYISVALSVGLPRLVVNQHRALWSADFPQPGHAEPRFPCSPGTLIVHHLRRFVTLHSFA